MTNSINYAVSLATTQTNLMSALQKLSSGKSINSAADNPAGMAQSTSYSVQLSGLAQAMNNAQNGISMLDTAGGALNQITQGLQDIRTLTVQAGNGTLNASDLQTIQSQINQISQGINQIAGNTQFNGQNILDGTAGSLTLQVGPNAGSTQTIQFGNNSSDTLGISALNVTTPAGQTSALSTLDNAIQQVSNQSANIGAAQASLNSVLSTQNTLYTNLSAANSQISDTDYAKSTANLAQANVQQQASLHALALYNTTQKNILSLLS